MESGVRGRLRPQLDGAQARLLAAVLDALTQQTLLALGDNLLGVYLQGSFALGAGDIHSDVDVLVVSRRAMDSAEEAAVREIHRALPDREEHWARVVEGSYVSLADLRERADPAVPWLYVDNGSRDMERSAHDNTEVLRWVLRHGGIAVHGPPAATLVDDVPAVVLRREAAALAVQRTRDIAADPEYLRNACGQPHEVLTRCRLLFTATRAEVAGKADAAAWCRGVLPAPWHDLIDRAVASRPDPWQRLHQRSDPVLAGRTRELVDVMAPMIARAAAEAGQSAAR